MKKSVVLTAVALLALVLALPAAHGLLQPQGGGSLYARLGGFDGISALVDDFAPRLATDPGMARLFGGHGRDSQLRQRQLAILYICEKAGGPCTYIGRPMKSTHTGLGITESDWETSMKHLAVSLDKLKITGKEREELMGLVDALKKDIVEASPSSSAK